MADTTDNKKPFWFSKEGIGGWFMLAGLGALAFYIWGKVSGFVLQTMFNTFWATVYAIGLGLLLMIVFSPKTRLIFRLISRKITGLIINIDPIGILKDRVAEMRKRMEKFRDKKDSLAGALQQVEGAIRSNEKEIGKQQKVACTANANLESGVTDITRKLRLQTELRIASNEVSRLQESNKEYRALFTTLSRIQTALERATIYLDGFIRDGQNEAREWEKKRKTSGVARGAIADAMSILRGNASEQDLYESTLAHLADEYDDRLGQIDAGLRDLESFMEKVDLQTGIVDAEAFTLVDQFEQKLALPARSAVVEVPKMQQTEYAKQGTETGYAGLFTKKGGK